jgi:hypothetical protein
MSYNIPILLVFWRRDDLVLRVIDCIRRVKPKYLYLACDGPRTSLEAQQVIACRHLVESSIDWECIIQKRYSTDNLGCKHGVSTAIGWFFENVEYGLIFEDDILVHHTFFDFAEKMLFRYQNDNRIGSISSASYINQSFPQKSRQLSYFTTEIGLIWGWATWRDRWYGYTASPPYISILWILFSTSSSLPFRSRIYYIIALLRIKKGKLDTWDFQWDLHFYRRKYHAIVPEFNMCTNLGFGDDRASHTSSGDSPLPPIRAYRDSSALLEYCLSPSSSSLGQKYARTIYQQYYPPKFTIRKILKILFAKITWYKPNT